MSPEAVRGEVSFKSDAFAFGVVMLEALTGLPVQKPAAGHANLLSLFEDEMEAHGSLVARLDRRSEGCTWPASLIATMSSLHSVITRCLEPRKRSRAEVADLIAELEAVRIVAEAARSDVKVPEEYVCPINGGMLPGPNSRPKNLPPLLLTSREFDHSFDQSSWRIRSRRATASLTSEHPSSGGCSRAA